MSAALIVVALIGFLMAAISMRLLFGRLREVPKALADRDPGVSVIIPARNEAANLRKLLPSLTGQKLRPLEIIVVDDQSEDGTAEVARSLGAKVLSGKALPEGWFGKPWACQQGAEDAKGEVLLFLDADVELEEDALSRLAAETLKKPGAVLSVCPWHRTELPYEQLSVFFNLLMVGGIGAFTWKGDEARGIGLFGQTMWIPSSLYQEIGGHHKVRLTVLENFHLSRELEEIGVERACYLGRGCISMRMFPGGMSEMMSSWAKGFSSGAGLTPKRVLLLSSLWLTGLMILTVNLFLLPLGDVISTMTVLGVYILMAVLLAGLFRKIGDFTRSNALLFPLSLLFYQGLFGSSLIRKRQGGTVQWKGRDVA